MMSHTTPGPAALIHTWTCPHEGCWHHTRVQDQRRSRVNEKLVTALRVGRLADSAVNLVEVDDVCDHGLQLAAVLSARALAARS